MFAPTARPSVLDLRASQIREVANVGMELPDVLPFWVGESDRPTPDFVREAAIAGLNAGRTLYTHNRGRPDLRGALSGYLHRLHGVRLGEDRLAVTSAGVSALMLAAQAIVEPGDKVAVVAPVWPNVVEIPRILSAKMQTVQLDPAQGRWRLDLDKLMDALTPDTRALFLNSPNNPTGWTLPAEDRAAILARCREYGIWLIADDVYQRLAYGMGDCAPSFLEIADPEDRLISTNSFSKAWRMTGWRLGWMVLPKALVEPMGVLIEYNTSCAPDFIQDGAIAALEQGEASIAEFRAELMAARDQVVAGLRAFPQIEAPQPDGGMYAFFRLGGCTNAMDLAMDMLRKVGLGLAPGTAFGPEGEGWMRWCFAHRAERNAEGLDRLARYLNA